MFILIQEKIYTVSHLMIKKTEHEIRSLLTATSLIITDKHHLLNSVIIYVKNENTQRVLVTLTENFPEMWSDNENVTDISESE